MNVPVVTGTGRWVELDTDDHPRLVVLPEACADVDPQLWELFAEPATRDGGVSSGSWTSPAS